MNTLTATKVAIRQPVSFQKGLLFETYIRNLFNGHYFEVKKWRRSEILSGINFSPDFCNPDLEMVFGRGRKYRFAVECKWRRRFEEGKIIWASDSQISIYEKFELENRIPVFIAIGIGGGPDCPEKLFITPLQYISDNIEVHEQDLIPYKRKPSRKFFYDTMQLKLF